MAGTRPGELQLNGMRVVGSVVPGVRVMTLRPFGLFDGGRSVSAPRGSKVEIRTQPRAGICASDNSDPVQLQLIKSRRMNRDFFSGTTLEFRCKTVYVANPTCDRFLNRTAGREQQQKSKNICSESLD